MTNEVLSLGDPRLRTVSAAVASCDADETRCAVASLKLALDEFRAAEGFGRGIAAVQIGIPLRIIALNLGRETFCLFNPEIVWQSAETFEMWDDCMSFPDLVVKVRRHCSISVKYMDEVGQDRVWAELDQAAAELLQHEIDHLDGILAIDRALSSMDLIYKAEYRRHRAFYDQCLAYCIAPTLR